MKKLTRTAFLALPPGVPFLDRSQEHFTLAIKGPTLVDGQFTKQVVLCYRDVTELLRAAKESEGKIVSFDFFQPRLEEHLELSGADFPDFAEDEIFFIFDGEGGAQALKMFSEIAQYGGISSWLTSAHWFITSQLVSALDATLST